MTAAEQQWIDNSLERLEALHAEREQVVASRDANKLAEIDEEIASLTEVLEAVADASGPINVAAANQAQPATPAVTDRYRPVPMVDTTQRQQVVQAPMPGTAAPRGLTERHPAVSPVQAVAAVPAMAPAVAPAPAPAHAPKMTERMPAIGQPQPAGMHAPPVAQAPMAQVPGQAVPGGTMPNPAYTPGAPGFTQASPPVSSPIDSSMDYGGYDDDLDMPKKSPMIWVAIAGIVLALGGVGAFFAMQGGGEEEKKAPAEPQEAKVITAAEVPDDTSEPIVAQGADADRTAGTIIKGAGTAPAAEPTKSSGGNRSSGNRRSGNRNKGKDDGRTLKFDKSRDPLSGLK